MIAAIYARKSTDQKAPATWAVCAGGTVGADC
jgi:hypothetical protein